jgi:LacI family transcriptional regulator
MGIPSQLIIPILLNVNFSCNRAVIRGAFDYARQKNWHMFVINAGADIGVRDIPHQAHGVLFHVSEPSIKRMASEMRCPVVALMEGDCGGGRWPAVAMDDLAVGEMAARYFIERNFQSFAYTMVKDSYWERGRRDGFCRALARCGRSCSLSPARARTQDQTYRNLQRWIVSLPKPVALFAANDSQALFILEICQTVGIHVPHQVAVVGVDNDDFFRDIIQPALSSVDTPWERVGFEAAKLLDERLAGAAVENKAHYLPPVQVITRQSSDVFAVEDATVQKAVQFIRLRATTPIGVEDVADAVALSRRVLEKRFRRILGTSPLREIVSVRIDHARQLLINSDMPMQQVAVRSGFSNGRRLSEAFALHLKISPFDYRQKFRLR